MANSKKEQPEPTLRDVVGRLDEQERVLFKVMLKLDRSNTAIRHLYDLVGGLSGRLQEGFETLNTRMDGIDERLIGVEHRLGSLEVNFIELKDEVHTNFAAYDKDSEIILDHEARIKRL